MANFDQRTWCRRASNRPRLGGALISALAIATVISLGACESRVSIRGNMPDIEEMEAINPGVDSKEDVVARLGTPSSVSTFMDNTWYYIGQRVEQFAFYAPEVTDRSVLVIEFDQSGIVGDTRYLTIYDGHAIDPVSRETPTEGKELTVMQQLLGNFGRLPTDPGNPNQRPF